MKIFQFKTYSTLLVLILYLLYPAILLGQDLTESELEELEIHRERLIQQGYLHDDEEIPSLQSSHSEPVIVHASYTNKSASFATENSRATDFNPNGTRFYILGRATRNIVEYQLSNAWDIESGSSVGELDISAEMGSAAEDDSAPNGLFFRKNDGAKMWVFNRTEIWEYTLSTPWDVTTATQTGYKDLSSSVFRGHDIDFKPDGSVLYVDDRILESVFQFDLSTTWDVETANLDYMLDISNKQEEVRGTQFNSNGDRMYLMDTGRKDVLEYSLSDPYDLESADFIGNFSVGSQTSDPRGLTFKPDFTTFYVTSADNNRVFQYEIRYVDPDESSITADNLKVIANGSATSRITVTLRDEDRNRLEGRKVSLTSNGSNAVIDPVNSTSNSNGEARFDVHNSSMESATFQASALGITINQEISISFVTVDPSLSTVSVSPSIIQADHEEFSTISILTRDEDGDILAGASVSLEPQSGSSTIQAIQNITDSNGEAFFRVRNSRPETIIYTILAENIELEQKAEVNFMPIAPVSLAPQEVGTRSFIANWELVDGTETYLLDVATDSSFSSFVAGFQNKDVGNTSSVLIENLNPGRSYYYRVRAMSMGLISANSEIIGTTTFPETPVALPVSELNALDFIAVWEAAEGAEKYRIDVATDHQFEQMVDGYEDAVVEDGEELVIDDLEMGTSYFYRLRSVAGPRVSPNSNSIEATTLMVNRDHSEISFAQFRVLADGNQSNEIRIIVKSDEGYLLKGLEVALVTEDEQSEIEAIQPITDQKGLARFSVKSSEPGKVRYEIVTEGIILGEVTVEFLEADGELKLGDNFPNPFRSETRLPVTVPGTMEVQLTVFNSIGAPVRTVLNETIETGYYEVLLNMDDLASGVYFYRLIADGEVEIGKLVLVK